MKVKIAEDVVFRNLSEEAVLLNLSTGNYFGLDEIGTRVWNLLAENASIEKIVEILLGEYDVTEQVLRSDLRALLGQLQEKGLIKMYE